MADMSQAEVTKETKEPAAETCSQEAMWQEEEKMGQQEWIPRRREHLLGRVKLTGCVPMQPSYDAFVNLDHGAVSSKRGATIVSGGRAFWPGRSGSPKPLTGAAAHLSSSDGLCASSWLGATGGPARAQQICGSP